ncbi:MAG TPA: hypothetical protein VNA26_07835 [Chitinophagaceae bacterium]|nr:hypothetical protein [Chitinophagaceae bacterium]
MRNVSLQFHSITALIDFIFAANANDCDMNKLTLILNCELSENQIELAKNKYGASFVCCA